VLHEEEDKGKEKKEVCHVGPMEYAVLQFHFTGSNLRRHFFDP
jgi:hypothetical protein